MATIKIEDIVFHHGHGEGLSVLDVTGLFAFCIPVGSLKNPPREAPGYLVSELVEIKELMRRKKQ